MLRKAVLFLSVLYVCPGYDRLISGQEMAYLPECEGVLVVRRTLTVLKKLIIPNLRIDIEISKLFL